jgi:O-antigen/teichoic acid export membrane protein
MVGMRTDNWYSKLLRQAGYPDEDFLDSDSKNLIRGSFVALILKLLGAVSGFGLAVLLGRTLGAEATGIYYLSLSIVTFAAVVGRFGLDNPLLRWTAVHSENQHWSLLRAVIQKGFLISLMTGITATLILFVSAPFLADKLFQEPGLIEPLRLMSISIIPMALLLLYGEVFKGLRKTGLAIFLQTVEAPTITLMAALILIPFWHLEGAVYSYVTASVVALVTAHLILRGYIPLLQATRDRFPIKDMLSPAIPLLVVAIMQIAMQLSATVILGIWEKSSAVGTFGVSTRTVQLMGFFLVAVNSVIAPRIAALYQEGKLAELARIAQFAAFLVTIASLPLLALFIVAPEWILRIFGVDFLGGKAALSILGIGRLVSLVTGPSGLILIMCGNERTLMKAVCLASACQLLFCLLLIPPLGITGAAIAASLGLICLNLSTFEMVRRRHGILVLPIPRKKNRVL